MKGKYLKQYKGDILSSSEEDDSETEVEKIDFISENILEVFFFSRLREPGRW